MYLGFFVIRNNSIFAQFAEITLGHLPKNVKWASNHGVSTEKKVKAVSMQDVEFRKLHCVCVHMHSLKWMYYENHKSCCYFAIKSKQNLSSYCMKPWDNANTK